MSDPVLDKLIELLHNDNQKEERMTNVNDQVLDVLSNKVGITGEDVQALEDQRTTDYLRRLGGGNQVGEDLIRDHADGQNYVLKPADMSEEVLSVEAAKAAKAKAATVNIPEKILARPDDGGIAFMTVLKSLYGFSPTGVTLHNPFTGEPIYPEFRHVHTGEYNDNGKPVTVSVPKSLMEFSRGKFQMTFEFAETNDEDYGLCFFVNIQTNKGNEPVVKGILSLVKQYIEENSLYRGKVIEGVGRVSGGRVVEPKFVNIWAKRDIPLFFEKEVGIEIDNAIYAILEDTDLQRAEGTKIGSTVILAGDPGNGKTETVIKAAKAAMHNTEQVTVLKGQMDLPVTRSKWTVIFVKPEEDFNLVTKFASRIGGCVLLVSEDAEYRAEFTDKKQRTKFLNDLDGMGSKGEEVMKIFTTNKPEAFEDETGAVFRAERVDDLIEIGLPDQEAVMGMIYSMVPEHIREGEFDGDEIWSHCEGYTLAWVAGGVKRARRAATRRTGTPGAKISTSDIVAGLISYRGTFLRYLKAREGKPEVTIEDLIRRASEQASEDVFTNRIYLDNPNVGQTEVHHVSERGEMLTN